MLVETSLLMSKCRDVSKLFIDVSPKTLLGGSSLRVRFHGPIS